MDTQEINTEQVKELQDFNTFMNKAKSSSVELPIECEFQKADILDIETDETVKQEE